MSKKMNEKYCKLIKNEFVKNGKQWQLKNTIQENITKEYYENIINSKSFFVNLGGYEKHIKTYTYKGYLVSKVISISPVKNKKSEYNFIFEV